jgi:hypothetical protein
VSVIFYPKLRIFLQVLLIHPKSVEMLGWNNTRGVDIDWGLGMSGFANATPVRRTCRFSFFIIYRQIF